MPKNTKHKQSRVTKAVQGSILCLGMASGLSHAATIIVTSNADTEGMNSVGCTFREALGAMNAANTTSNCSNSAVIFDPINGPMIVPFGTDDAIGFNSVTLANSTITLSDFLPTIDTDIDIQGFDGLTIDGDNEFKVFDFDGATVSLSQLTVQNGDFYGITATDSILTISDTSIRGNTANYGAGITISESSLSINNSSITGNKAGSFGGAIRARSNSSLSIKNSIISDNFAYSGGGGISISGSSILSLNNSSITGNSTNGNGGAIEQYNNGGGLISLNNSTISGNTARRQGGAIDLRDNSTISLSNTTVTDNTALISTGGISTDVSGANVTFQNSIIANSVGGDCDIQAGILNIDSASIIEDGSCNTQRAIDPQLGPLADNGGGTLSHALLPNSPARNTGNLATCETEDQRGQVRDDSDGACDVGAIEFSPNDDFGESEVNFYVIPLSDGKTVVIPL